MTQEEILNSINIKKRFCKDYNLPITVYDNPYFMERLLTLDPMFETVEKFTSLCCCLSGFKSEQDYFDYYNKLKDAVITHIKSNPSYTQFCDNNIDKKFDFPKKNLYSPLNDGCTFISIDMKKANFSALNHFDSAIFSNRKTWEDFLRIFTDYEYIVNSKYIRQVILGACNPGKQIAYEHYLMGCLLTHIKEEIPNVNIYSLGEDEILIQVDGNCGYSKKRLQEVINSYPGKVGDLVKVNIFDLHIIKNTSGYIKSYYYGGEENVEFKCLDAEIYHQIVKHFYDIPITENDLVIYHNGHLAKLLKEVPNPWED